MSFNKKKILVISSSFYPELSPRSFRTTELVKELAKQGHEVVLYTLKDDQLHPSLEMEFNFSIKDLGKLKFGRINSNHSNKFISVFKRISNRLLLMLFEYPDIELMFRVIGAIKAEKKYDLLISIAVPFPIHWGVARARKKNQHLSEIWVADCGDPYMGNHADSFKKLFYFKYVEKWFCRIADYITVPTAGSMEAYYPEFHSKIKVIPQGFNMEATQLYENAVDNPVISFAYAGGFIAGIRDPGELLEYLSALAQPFRFIIYTNNTAIVEPFVSRSGGRIELRHYIPREQLLYELSKMDFLVNFTNGTSVQTPSKLIDYAIVARPILSIDTHKLDKLIVNEFLVGNYTNKYVIDNLEQYNIKNVAKQFTELTKH